MPPIMPEFSMVFSDSSITSPWLNSVSICSEERRGSAFICSTASATALETSLMLASPSLRTTTATAGRLMARTRNCLSGSS